MRKLRFLAIPILFVTILGFAVAPTYAQSSGVITAEVDRKQLSTDEALMLTVRINRAAGQPTQRLLPDLDGFTVLGTSQSTEMSIVNSDVSVNTVYNYQLQPTKTGELVIPSISLTVNGQTYQTEPIRVQVTQGNGQGQAPLPSLPSFPSLGNFGQFPAIPNFPNFPSIPNFPSLGLGSPSTNGPVEKLDASEAPDELVGQRYYIEGKVDKSQPYQGEQVIYTVRIYHSENLPGQMEFTAPEFTGFWNEQDPVQTNYVLETPGRTYQVTELKTVLFPTVIGPLVIDPASLSIPGGLLSNGQTLQSKPISLNVKPLPDNAPADFQGAVGQYSISAETGSNWVEANDTVDLNVTISGTGNLNNLPDPLWDAGSNWRTFAGQVEVTAQLENDTFAGERVYDHVLVPTTSGKVEIPAISYTYFDPVSSQYEIIQTEAISIEVGPGEIGASNQPSPLIQTETVSISDQSLRPLKAAPTTWLRGSTNLAQQAGYWLLWGIPLLVVASQVGWQRYQSHEAEATPERQRRQAAQQAYIALRKSMEKSGNAYIAAGVILNEYLAARFRINPEGLTHTALAQQLTNAGAPSRLVAMVQDIRSHSEMGAYAPSGSINQAEDMLKRTELVIHELEKVSD